MLITVGGKAGSGKGTCIELLAEMIYKIFSIKYSVISVGDIKRDLAKSMHLSIQEFNLLGELPENIESFDKKYEEMQKGIDPSSNIILDSRLSYRCQPKGFKIFLDVEPIEGAKRINNANRITDNHGSLEETIRINQERNHLDSVRYMRLYNTNPWDLQNYDLIVDTTALTPEKVVEKILVELQKNTSFIS